MVEGIGYIAAKLWIAAPTDILYSLCQKMGRLDGGTFVRHRNKSVRLCFGVAKSSSHLRFSVVPSSLRLNGLFRLV